MRKMKKINGYLVVRFNDRERRDYDRYLKGVQQSGMTRASKTFLLDCVVDEDRDRLTSELEEYPGVALTIAGKLTEILGLTNAVNLKKL